MSDRKDIALSKSLSRILRHRANEENLFINEEGYVRVSSILQHRLFASRYTLEDIERVVATNNKQRFSLRLNGDALEICANQGHSIPGLDKLHLIPICKAETFDVIHGTYFKNWTKIKTDGLHCMKRNHIHFAKGLPADGSVISGIRNNCQVYIYINLKLSLADGLKFYISKNEVILSPGNENGIILPKYFLKVCDRHGHLLI